MRVLRILENPLLTSWLIAQLLEKRNEACFPNEVLARWPVSAEGKELQRADPGNENTQDELFGIIVSFQLESVEKKAFTKGPSCLVIFSCLFADSFDPPIGQNRRSNVE